jgi:hypothetical protein
VTPPPTAPFPTIPLGSSPTAAAPAAAPASIPAPAPAPTPALTSTPVGGGPDPGAGWVGRTLSDPGGLVHAVLDHARDLTASYGPRAVLVAAVTVLAWAAVRAWARARRRARWAQRARLVTITPPPAVDPAGGPALWGHLVGLLRPAWARALSGQPHLGFEYTWAGPTARIDVWVPGVIPPGLIERAVEAAWPGAHTNTRPCPPSGGPLPAGDRCTGGRLRLARHEILPLAGGQDADPLRAVFGAATRLTPDEHACVQILARPAAGRRVRAARRAARHLQHALPARPAARLLDLLTPGPTSRRDTRTGPVDPQRAADLRAATTKLSEPLWEVRILYGVTHPDLRPRPPHHLDARTGPELEPGPEPGPRHEPSSGPSRVGVRGRLRGNAHALASAFALYSGRNFLTRRRLRHPARALAARAMNGGDLLSVTELAALAHLPLDAATPGLARAGARAVAPPPAVPITAPAPTPRAGPPAAAPDGNVDATATSKAAGTADAGNGPAPGNRTSPGPDPNEERPAPRTPGAAERPEDGGRVKVLGDTDTGPRRGVGLTVADARHHLHVIGATGSGKSTLLANLVLADARAGRGVLLVDPKGDLVTDLLDRLPVTVADRLTVIDPDDPSRPPCLNPLDPAPGADLDTAVDNLVGIFRRIYTAYWGPRTDDVARAAALTLLHHRRRLDPRTRNHFGPLTGHDLGAHTMGIDLAAPGLASEVATLADIPRLLDDTDYRARATAGITNDVLAGFWAWYERLSPGARAQAAGPLLNKLRAFLLRPFVAATIAAGPATLDLDAVLDGGITLVRLPKGLLGEETSRLLGSFVLARAWQAAAARARTGRPRHDAALYLDEAHNYLNLPYPIEDMLAEARGYRLSMVLAHQNLAQLPRDLREGISANARNKIFFNASPEDARDLQRHTVPTLAEHDLSHLGAFQAAARLVVGSAETSAFTLRTRPLPPPVPGRAAHLRRATARTATASARTSAPGPGVPTPATTTAAAADPRARFRTGAVSSTTDAITPAPADHAVTDRVLAPEETTP